MAGWRRDYWLFKEVQPAIALSKSVTSRLIIFRRCEGASGEGGGE